MRKTDIIEHYSCDVCEKETDKETLTQALIRKKYQDEPFDIVNFSYDVCQDCGKRPFAEIMGFLSAKMTKQMHSE